MLCKNTAKDKNQREWERERDLGGGRSSWSGLRTRSIGEVGVTVERREGRVATRRRSPDGFGSKRRRRRRRRRGGSVNVIVRRRRWNGVRVPNCFVFENRRGRRRLWDSLLSPSIRHGMESTSIQSNPHDKHQNGTGTTTTTTPLLLGFDPYRIFLAAAAAAPPSIPDPIMNHSTICNEMHRVYYTKLKLN